MDPIEVLNELQGLLLHDADGVPYWKNAQQAAEAFFFLDTWMKKQGFSPWDTTKTHRAIEAIEALDASYYEGVVVSEWRNAGGMLIADVGPHHRARVVPTANQVLVEVTDARRNTLVLRFYHTKVEEVAESIVVQLHIMGLI